MSKSIQICSDNDLGSFFVPAYGFNSEEDAKAYWESSEYLSENRIYGRDDAYKPLVSYKTYVPRVSVKFGRWGITDFINNQAASRGKNPTWEVLSKNDIEISFGAYNVLLAIEGPREFFRCHNQSSRNPKWWYYISDGNKDCYTVWGRQDNSCAGRPVLQSGNLCVYPVRFGRGVIYSCETQFDNSGKPCGYQCHLIRAEVNIFDKDPDKDNMLRVNISHQISFIGKPDINEDLDDVWKDLIKRAIDGFEQYCHPVKPDIEKWRKSFIEQKEKAAADLRKFDSESFSNYIRELDWEQALKEVQEPWQLSFVASYHGRNGRFSSDGGVYTIPYECVPEMIRQHNCSEDRRASLMKMIEDYVEPADSLWNYRGD